MKKTLLAFTLPGLLASSAIAGEAMYKITPLDTGGSFDAYAGGINDAGVIVGRTEDANGLATGMKWTLTGAGAPLAGLPGTNGHAEVYRVNSSGAAVGLVIGSDGFSHGAMWKADGTLVDIGTLPGGTFSFANDIADNGVVVGSAGAEIGGSHAFTWTEAGGMVDFGSFNNTDRFYYAGFNAVNNAGLKAGTGYRLFTPYHACVARPGDRGITDISPQRQYSQGMALAVNEGGTIVGWQNINGIGSPHPVIFNDDGSQTDLGTLGLGEGWAMDVNEAGVIVGRVFGVDELTGDQIFKAFVYQNGTMTDLMTLIDQPTDGTAGWTQLFEATGINNLGQIVGEGVYNGEIRPFALTLTPEPTSLAAIALGSLVLRRRR